jgi:hypothetical protein
MNIPFLRRPSPEALQALRETSERRLTADELASWVNAPWTTQELEDAVSLVTWFSRRYPTPLARLEAARRAARRAKDLAPRGSG